MARFIDNTVNLTVFLLFVFLTQSLGALVVVSVARAAHADALLVERDFSPNGVRSANFSKQSRLPAAAIASAPLAFTLNSAAALALALAALNAVPPVPQTALQLAALCGSSVLLHQALPTASQSFSCLIYLKSLAEKLARAKLPRAKFKVKKLRCQANPQAIQKKTSKNAIKGSI